MFSLRIGFGRRESRSAVRRIGIPFALVSVLCVSVVGQQQDDLEPHIAAAKVAAGETWLSLYSELCGPARGGGRRYPLITQTRRAEKVFDNLYVLSNNDVLAWVVQTSGGIILIDTTYDTTVKDLIVDRMTEVGLDPKQIKYILLTHGHSDHAGGAKYLQDTYGARVLASAADWELLAQAGRGRNAAPPVAPAKDMVITDGQQLTLGDTTLTMHVTPATSLGTVSLIIPVRHSGSRHVAAFWGGNVIGPTSPKARLTMFADSAQRFESVATTAGADVLLTNHERYFDLNKRLFALQANPRGTHPFVVGPARVRSYMQVLNSCTTALSVMSTK